MILACGPSPIFFLPPIISIACGLVALGCCVASARAAAMGWGIASLFFGIWFVPTAVMNLLDLEIWSLFFGGGPAMGLSAIAYSIRLRANDDRLKEGHCHQCGYDLTANVSGRCPECGTPVIVSSNLPSTPPPPS